MEGVDIHIPIFRGILDVFDHDSNRLICRLRGVEFNGFFMVSDPIGQLEACGLFTDPLKLQLKLFARQFKMPA